jgi:hypothetical protein
MKSRARPFMAARSGSVGEGSCKGCANSEMGEDSETTAPTPATICENRRLDSFILGLQ